VPGYLRYTPRESVDAPDEEAGSTVVTAVNTLAPVRLTAAEGVVAGIQARVARTRLASAALGAPA
jgi:hypothetical protein